jgi:hypothetical protein
VDEMKIALDLDGVCYEFQRTYRYMMKEYRGVDMPPVKDFWFSWDSNLDYGTSEDRKWMWSEGVKMGLFRYGHVTTGVIASVQRLAAMGHQLSVVTHRPENAVQDTLDWLSYVRLPISGVHILSNGEPKTTVGFDALVDDKVENIRHALARGRVGVLFNQPWNQEQSGISLASGKFFRAHDWPEVVGYFNGL